MKHLRGGLTSLTECEVFRPGDELVDDVDDCDCVPCLDVRKGRLVERLVRIKRALGQIN